MRKKVKSEGIDGFTYEVTQLGATEGQRLLVKLSKILLPAIGALVKGSDVGALDLATVDIDSAAKALAGSLSPDEFDTVVAAMSASTEIWGPGFGDEGAPMPRHFDEHFAGRYVAMLKWLAFALKVNFADFFDGKGLGGLVTGLRSPVAPSVSPST